jgi:hypothetical protein
MEEKIWAMSSKLIPEESDYLDELLGDEIVYYILDTVCEKCNHWYGMIEYHPTSKCTKCGHIQET